MLLRHTGDTVNWGVRFRLTVGLSMIIVLIMGIGAAVTIYQTVQTIRVSAEARGLAFSRSFAMIGGQAVLENLFLIQEALGRQVKNHDILQIDVIDTDDMIVAAQHPERIGTVLRDDQEWKTTRSRETESLEYQQDGEGEQILVVTEPLYDQGRVSAWVRVVFSLSNIRQEVLFAIGRMAILTLLLVAAGMFAMRFTLRHMARLLHQIVIQLQEALSSLSQASPHGRIGNTSMTPEDELEHLAEAATVTTKLLKTQSDSLRALTVSLDEKVRERTIELDEQRRKAEEANRLKSTFLANLNHELRTPLNGILGTVNVLSEEAILSDQQRERLRILHSCAQSLKDLISDVLDLSKIEAGKMELACDSFEPRIILERITDILAPRAAEKRIELVCRVDHSLPRLLKGDPGRLQEIMLNLAGNALKFTPTGEVEIGTRVVEKSANSLLVEFFVRDSGIGIPQDKLQTIFEPFMQVANGLHGRREGTGLGLSICRKLVELMGGEMGVESEPGRGSRFWFTARFEQDAALTPSSTPVIPQLRGVKVLIVDDNGTCRKMLVERLTAEGALPEEAADSESSLLAIKDAAATGRPFDLVVLDDDIPGQDAEDVADVICAAARPRSIPIILLTSIKRTRSAEQLIARGIPALPKPIRESQFVDAFSRVLGCPLTSTTASQATPAVEGGAREAGRKSRILLVEDNEANQMVVGWYLHETDYRLDIASTGQDALRLLEREHYDLLLLDIQLPDLTGEKLVELVRSRSDWAHLPILVLTAASMPDDIARLAAAGVPGYLIKPLERNVLLSAIDNVLRPLRGVT